jgi:hypothetical protein
VDEGGGTRPLTIRNTADPEEGDSEQCRIAPGPSDINNIAQSRAFRMRRSFSELWFKNMQSSRIVEISLLYVFQFLALNESRCDRTELACTRQKVPLNTLLYLFESSAG